MMYLYSVYQGQFNQLRRKSCFYNGLEKAICNPIQPPHIDAPQSPFSELTKTRHPLRPGNNQLVEKMTFGR